MTNAGGLERIAVAIAQEAAALAMKRRAEGVTIAATKSTVADIVTAADREVEDLIRARLAEQRPNDGFLGEESEQTSGESGVTWIVDPIDGTVNYATGFADYAVSIAAVTGPAVAGEWTAQAAAVVAPQLGEVFHAHRGGGAWLGDERLTVSIPGPAGILLGTGFGYDRATHADDLATLGAVMPLARDIRRMGSAALDLANVAAGRLEASVERGWKPWDHAAGDLLVFEAGGRVVIHDRDAERPLFIAGAPQTVIAIEAALGLKSDAPVGFGSSSTMDGASAPVTD